MNYNYKILLSVLLVILMSCSSDESINDTENQQLESLLMISEEETIGDPNISYLNPEFSDDGKYMIWIEQTSQALPNGDVKVNVWHCGIEPETGNMIPANGKGFLAFESTIYKRPNMGFDINGAYYVGADIDGNLILVRPQGSTSGTVQMLPTPANVNRRGIFPSVIQQSSKQYVYWFSPDVYPFPADTNEISVEYIDVADPMNIILVQTQQNNNPGSSWASMDLAVPRWIDGLPEFTFGFGERTDGGIQVKLIHINDDGSFTERNITNHNRNHFDPSPFYFNGSRYIMPGDGNNSIVVYKEQNDVFSVFKQFTVDNTNSSLIEPCSTLSNEPFVLGGNYFSIFLTSECGGGANGNFITSNGEVFLIGIESEIEFFGAISKEESQFVKNEPEVVVTTNKKAFVFYNAYPLGMNPVTATYQLRRIAIEIE